MTHTTQQTTSPQPPSHAASGLRPQAARPVGLAATAFGSAPPVVQQGLASPGQPLDEVTRSFMESRLGHDFSRVRVHADARANESARAVNAAAFTAGSDIVFGSGTYSPQTPRGRRLITHELVHVVQHQAARAAAGAPLSSTESNPDELQADGAALRLALGLPASVGPPVGPSALLSLAPEVWYRGEVVGGQIAKDAKPGGRGVVHDLGDGQYYTDSADIADVYTEMRAPDDPSGRVKLGGIIDPPTLGRVLDLTKEPDFMLVLNIARRGIPRISGEPFRNVLNHFLARKGLKLEDYDMIVAPEGVRDGKQMCVRTPEVVAKVRAAMSPLKPGETVKLPAAPPPVAATPPPAVAPPVVAPPATVQLNPPPVMAPPPVVAPPVVAAPPAVAPPLVVTPPPIVAPPPVAAPPPPAVASQAAAPRPQVRIAGPRININPTDVAAQEAAAELEALAEQEAAEAAKPVARARATASVPNAPAPSPAASRGRMATGGAAKPAIDPLDALAVAEQKAAEQSARAVPRVRIGTGAAGKPAMDPLDALAVAEQEAAEKSARAIPRVRIGTGVAKPSAAPAPAAALNPSAAGAKAPASPAGVVEPAVAPGGSGRPRVTPGRVGVGLAKAVGPMVLDMLNRYQMAKEQSEHAGALIDRTVESERMQAAITALVEGKRLDVARRQLRGVQLYALISMTLRFTNDVLDTLRISSVEITDVNKNSLMSAVMSHDLFGTEGKNWYVDVSVPLAAVELSRTEEAAIELEIAEEKGHAPMTMSEEALAEASEERNRRMIALPEARREEAKEKQEALESPAVITDEKKRAQQQSEIAERLKQLASQPKTAPPPAAKKAAPSTPPPAPPAALPSLLPAQPAAQQTQFLPGMPGKDPVQLRMQAVAEAKAEAQRVSAIGRGLVDRVGTPDAPTDAERKAFFVDEARWRNAVKFVQNKFTADKYTEPAAALGELIDRYGPRLTEFRTRLGG